MRHRNKYIIQFRELHTSELWETYIQERSFTGTATNLTGSGVPLIREYRPENDNDYDWIRPSVCTVSMISETSRQFIEFFTSDDRKYKIKVYRDSVLMWAGWVIPETYKEPYHDVNYEVSISATDGLLSLKDVKWEQEPAYTGMISLMKGIEGCLSKLNLTDVHIWDASYLYEQNMSQADSSSPLHQAYFNSFLFYDDKGQPQDCYTVLKAILQSQNCQLWMGGGCWNIVPQNARKSSYVRRKYQWVNSDFRSSVKVISATASTIETYDPNVTLDNSNVVWYDGAGLSFRPGWKELNIKHNYGFVSNILLGCRPVFSQYFKGGIDQDGNILIQNHNSALNNHFEDEHILFTIGAIKADTYQKLRLTFLGKSFGLIPRIVVFIDGDTEEVYLDDAGDWRSGLKYVYPQFVDAPHIQDGGTYAWGASSKWEPVISKPIPIDGILKVRVNSAWQPLGVPNSPKQWASFNINDFKIEILSDLTFHEDVVVTTNINEQNTYIPEQIEISLADMPEDVEPIISKDEYGWNVIQNKFNQDGTNGNLLYKGILYYKSGENYLPTSLWTVKGRNKYNRLVNVISDEIAVNHIDPQWIYNGSMYGAIEYGSILAIDGKKYMMLRASQNAYNKEWETELFEIADTEQGYIRLRTGGYIKLRTDDKIKTQ